MSDRDNVTIERGVPAEAGTDPNRAGVLLTSPYNEELVDTLKSLPRGDRWWDEAREGWWVAAAHEEFVVEAAVGAFGGVRILGLDGESDYYVDRHGRSVQERLL